MKLSSVKYTGNLRTNAVHLKSGSEIETDAPIDNNGKGERFSPTDLVATALASCAITIMGIAAEKHGINLGAISAEVEKIMAADPRRISGINILFAIDGSYSEKEIKILKLAALSCPVAKSLHPDLVQNMEFQFADVAAVRGSMA